MYIKGIGVLKGIVIVKVFKIEELFLEILNNLKGVENEIELFNKVVE